MFISDHETEIDLLYYDAIASTVVKLIRSSPKDPLTVGIHGDWGAGKSSVLAMIKKQLDGDEKVLCLRFNGWQIQGFEDAKAALIESIITELRDARSGIDKIYEKASDLLKRVDYLKLAKKGATTAFSLWTGIPHPEQIRDAVSLLKGLTGSASDHLTPKTVEETVRKTEGIIRPGHEKKVPEHMIAFQKEFSDLLDTAKLEKLIVLIDDLDRCLPATAIETLEAIRLFLFAPKTAFVIATDEAMIEYAVRKHFPDLPAGAGNYTRNYLEKLIQVPFRLPTLGYTETQIYITLVLLQADPGADSPIFIKLLEEARKILIQPWKGATLDHQVAKACLGEVPENITQAITLSRQITRTLTDGTKGNPRLVKRFLNSLLLRQEIAQVRGLGADIKRPVLAKIMLAERFKPEFYESLTALAFSAAEGCPKEIAVLESLARGQQKSFGETKDDEAASSGGAQRVKEWMAEEWLANWAKIEPELKEVDLRPYVFVSRDKRSFIGGTTLTSLLDSLADALSTGKSMAVKRAEAQLRQLSRADADQLFEMVRAHYMEKEDFKQPPTGLIALAKCQAHLAKGLLGIIQSIPSSKLGTWPATGFDAVFLELSLKAEYAKLKEEWSKQDENQPLKQAVLAFSKEKAIPGSKR